MRWSGLQAREYFGWDRMRLEALGAGLPDRPHPRLERFHRQRVAFHQSMLDLETRAAIFGHFGFDRDVVAETGGQMKARLRRHHRITGEIVVLEISDFVHAERALEKRRGRGIEYLEVTRIKDDAGGVAVATFDSASAYVGQHEIRRSLVGYRGVMRKAASSRTTVPLR